MMMSWYSAELAYIGPGAGFAFLGSFLILLAAFLLVVLAVLSWPFRVVFSMLFSRKRGRLKASVKRVIIVGLDGLDPRRCESLMKAGSLPNFQALKDMGVFRPLATTCPPMSPVAWSSFMTGVNPGKHNIFDFLNRDLKSYVMELSSARIENIGNKKPFVRCLRKSKPFWHLLGEYGLQSIVLRVPLTFPPEKFKGLLLSGIY